MNAIAQIGCWACAVLAAAAVPAQEPSSTPRAAGGGLVQRFKQLDRNGDGKLSAEEFPGPLFKQMDKDGDGFVTIEEAQAFFAGRRTARPADGEPPATAAPPASPTAVPTTPPSPPAGGELKVVDAVFELCVRDVEACAKFYRDGIGMREIEPADARKGALLEWAGCFLRLRKAPGDTPAPATGNPMKQMLASNGFRWFSLWFNDPAAVGERLVKAGYAPPMKGGNVSMTRDPDGNVVELMRVPRGASAETFTWGMAVGDEAAARAFYGKVLGLPEFDPWNLPPPFSMKMYLFATGAGRIKFSAPTGRRPRDADAGPDAPGLRSVTLRVADLAAARDGLAKRGAKIEGESRLLLTDPDGNRIWIEAAPPDAAKAAAARSPAPAPAATPPSPASTPSPPAATPAATTPAMDRSDAGAVPPAAIPRRAGQPWSRLPDIKPQPHKEEVASRRPGEPPLKKMPDGAAARDAAGHDTLFKSICAPGVTDLQAGMNGVAVVDLNKDGLLDLVATYSPPRGTGGAWGDGEALRVFINEGGFRFRPHPVRILDSTVSPDRFGRGQVPVLADVDGDGFLDLFVTRHAQMSGGQSNPRDQKIGNGLYLSDGAWDVFRDASARMGIRNEKAYNRQPCFGDVNRDGFLDIAVGCDNIKNAMGGFPHSRLYVSKAEGGRMKAEDGRMKHEGGRTKDENGRSAVASSSGISHPSFFILPPFEDIGGTALVPDFGGFYHDSAKDKAGPDIALRDLDNDGDLDLIQSYHVDVLDLTAPYSPIEYRQGVFCWKNLLVETGALRFEKVIGNGLACEARLKLSADKKSFEPVGKAPGLPYLAFADVDNDGLQDVLAIGPASPGWAPRAEYVNGRFWRNRGGFRFQEATDAAGLSALNWTYRDWFKFFDAPPPASRGGARADPLSRRPYFACAIFGDFDNDGWGDLVVLDRHESPTLESRAILFMNRGDGAFEPKPTTFSGLDGTGICGVAADLNNDGFLDLLFAADPDNSGLATSMARYESKIYWNTGPSGSRANHWIRLRFSGVRDAELIGARVEAREPQTGRLLGTRWIHPDHFYKCGCAIEAHFGLGKRDRVDLAVALLNGARTEFAGVPADRFLDLDLRARRATTVEAPRRNP